jgi:hypothetical protein
LSSSLIIRWPKSRLSARRTSARVTAGQAFSQSACATPSLLHPPIKIARTPPPAAHVRIGVDELVGGQLVDIAGLRLALPVRERGRHDVVGDGLFGLVDLPGAEHRQTAPHDPGVFLRCCGHAVVGRDFGHVGGDMHLREMAVGREDQNALGGLAERKRLLAVGCRDLGDHEIPGADDPVLEARRRLRGGEACRQRKREQGGDGLQLHGIPPMCRRAGYPGMHRGARLLS